MTGLSRYDYNLFVITARPGSSAAGAMPAQKSIAGRFAVINDSNSGHAGDTRPATLPNTGEKPATTTRTRVLMTLAATIAASVGGGVWYRWNRGRNNQ